MLTVLIIYIVSAILTFGILNADEQAFNDNTNASYYDRRQSTAMCIFAALIPCVGLILAFFLTGFAAHGFTLKTRWKV